MPRSSGIELDPLLSFFLFGVMKALSRRRGSTGFQSTSSKSIEWTRDTRSAKINTNVFFIMVDYALLVVPGAKKRTRHS
jgi:hypothetical protein